MRVTYKYSNKIVGNEKEVGSGIHTAIREGIIKSRADLWITSKLWGTYHSAAHVPMALKRTLEDIDTDYLDLYLVSSAKDDGKTIHFTENRCKLIISCRLSVLFLAQIHWPIALKFVEFERLYPPSWTHPDNPLRIQFARVSFQETWRGMEDLVSRGHVRNIGLSNVLTASVWDILCHANIMPSVLQTERHVYNQQENLLRFCKNHNIATTAYSPLGASGYVDIGLARQQDSSLNEPIINELATKYKITPAQVLLIWNLQTGGTIISKSSVPARLAENIGICNLNVVLTTDDLAQIKTLEKRLFFNDPAKFMPPLGGFVPLFD